MKLSVKSDYAARALLGLARQYPSGRAIRVEDLANENGVSANYLTQILLELKSKQLVRSVRGKVVGYLLARPPSEITMADLLEAIHGQVFDSPALEDPQCPPELRDAWKQIQETFIKGAAEINFQSLLDTESRRSAMYYI